MMPSEEVERHVEGGKQAVRDALAAQPFRAEPSWDDLHTAIEAVLRYMFGGPKPEEPEEPEAGQGQPSPDTPQSGETQPAADSGAAAEGQTASGDTPPSGEQQETTT